MNFNATMMTASNNGRHEHLFGRVVSRFILLAGGLKPSPLAEQTGMSPLDLPLSRSATVIDEWIAQIRTTRACIESEADLVIAESSTCPRSSRAAHLATTAHDILVTCDTGLRGPAGAIRDLATGLDPRTSMVLIESSRIPSAELIELVLFHMTSDADVSVGRHEDGSPAGLYVVAAAAIRLIAEVGFIDIKEQWLKQVVDEHFVVRVVDLCGRPNQVLRTRESYLRHICSQEDVAVNERNVSFCLGASDTDCGPLVADDAEIRSTAIVRQSVVMGNARIEDDAIVARSIICPGAVVEAGRIVIDRVVTPVRRTGRGRSS